MTDAEKLQAVFDVLPALLENQRRILEALDALARPSPLRREETVVSLADAAAMLGVRPETLQRRKAGTDKLPRYSDRPVQFRLGAIEKFIREGGRKNQAETTPKRLSLVRRRKSA